MDLQHRKGYTGGFWIGFLLGIIGLIYSAGLPDVSKKKITQKDKEQFIERADELPEEPGNGEEYELCENCGFPVYKDEERCSNCGHKKGNRKSVT